jgi:trigger factor
VLDVKVPNDFPDEVLRGVDLKLEFHCEEVERIELPELDDAFAKEFGKKSLDELKAEIRESVQAQARRKEDQKIAATVLEKVLASVSIELPEGLLEGQKGRWTHNREYELLVEQGMPAEKVKETLAKEAEAAGEEFRRGLKEYFVLERIADKERIFATEEEVDKRLRLMATLYGVPAARLREEMRKTERLEELRYVLRHEKVREFLGKRARVLGPDGKPEEPPPEEVAADSGAPAEPASPAPESRTEGEFGT